MFRYGRFLTVLRDYTGGEENTGIFHRKGIVLDGGRIKTEPWAVFAELEKTLNLKPYFTENNFDKRGDGKYNSRFFDQNMI